METNNQEDNLPVIGVIDGDELAYVVAAACEKVSILVTNTTNDITAAFKHRTELKKFLTGLEVPPDFFTIKDLQEPDPIENALHTIKVRIANFKEAIDADHIEIYLSGKNNFRDALPLPKKYKGTRNDKLKPLLLKDIRNYLETRYKAEVIHGREVDDKVAERMYDGFKNKQKIVGITQDKDAMGTIGWVFNPNKMTEPEFISGFGSLWLEEKVNGKGKVETTVRGRGRKWLYTQWLMGDPTDEYNPCDICEVKFGEKSAYKLLVDCKNDEECIRVVYDTYNIWYPDPITSYTDWEGIERNFTTIQIMQMYLDCARMKRFEDDYVYVEDLLKGYGITYVKV